MTHERLLKTMAIVATIAIFAAVIIPLFSQAPRPSGTKSYNYEGWTWVGQTHRDEDIYMKHFPEQHITVYSSWRAFSVVKD